MNPITDIIERVKAIVCRSRIERETGKAPACSRTDLAALIRLGDTRR
jgi:hypothetical protein